MLDTLVLGIGNILLQDEGLGVRALERLTQDYCVPSAIQLVDGGVMGLDLLPYLEDLSTLLVIDAVQTGQPPGTLIRLEGDAIPATLALKMSMHQAGLQELLATSQLQGTSPSKVILWGMEPANMDWGLDLSAPVAAGLDALVQAVVGELRDWVVWHDLPKLDPPRHVCRGGSTNQVQSLENRRAYPFATNGK